MMSLPFSAKTAYGSQKAVFPGFSMFVPYKLLHEHHDRGANFRFMEKAQLTLDPLPFPAVNPPPALSLVSLGAHSNL